MSCLLPTTTNSHHRHFTKWNQTIIKINLKIEIKTKLKTKSINQSLTKNENKIMKSKARPKIKIKHGDIKMDVCVIVIYT